MLKWIGVYRIFLQMLLTAFLLSLSLDDIESR